ncbi:Glycosyl transferase family 4 [Rubrobacter radiotolerans]|uniref:Glycosyl transferase family 4 n=1 Tax=Rubrobacter radiotolerans TaxID=42256 RepID=A0A023X321_RUBRA|nr:hypothetical protein [Rubrobacter radiotolerans]AHY46738.1 Glycosyl transferase family 4 [Rubrobacter radiotolerans]MDX5894145.1 hypothetical protein [Rubrobacter radiotolerans]SMC05299.1 Glycosyl transferase family 4 [Rubrobacter radiotolerans DSM 5868]
MARRKPAGPRWGSGLISFSTLFALGAALALGTLALVGGRLPRRANYLGTPIPTATGLCLVPAGLVALAYLATDGGAVLCGYLLLAALVGAADDVWGDAGARGFRGHVGALVREGRITTGTVKLLALGGGSLAVGVYVAGFGLLALAAAFVLAGWTNLGNLFDVRPGRAIKFTGLPALLLLPFASTQAALAAAGSLGGLAALFYFDARARIMLGDSGAAVAGGVVGLLAVSSGSPAAWLVAGAVVVALTAVAEFSSITRLVEEVGVLRWFDSLGRARHGR